MNSSVGWSSIQWRLAASASMQHTTQQYVTECQVLAAMTQLAVDLLGATALLHRMHPVVGKTVSQT
jgi:hypothetical protein